MENYTVYVFELKKFNCAYVGITKNLNERVEQHNKDLSSPVFQFIRANKLGELTPIVLFDNVSKEEAVKLEKKYINKYFEDCWFMLNKQLMLKNKKKRLRRTKEECIVISSLYENKYEFNKAQPLVYKYSQNKKWLDDICAHMKSGSITRWSFEECKQEALKYNFRIDFRRGNINAYHAAWRNGWLVEICNHMKKLR